MKRLVTLATLLGTIVAAPAGAATLFTAALDGLQAGGTGSGATGTATLVLNDLQTELSYDVLIDGLDFAATLTPLDPNDDITNFHIHLGAPGVNGPVVFGMVGPGHDVDDFAFSFPSGQVRFTGVWDAADESTGAPPLADHLADLHGGLLYLNAHTPPFPSGEIRGQIVPEPAGALLLGSGLAGLAARRRALGPGSRSLS